MIPIIQYFIFLMRILTIILVLAFATFTYQAPNPPFWGGYPQYTVNVTLLNNNPILTWNFTYYYDSILKVERYEHKAPQADQMCGFALSPYGHNDSCVAIFATDGWSYIEYPQHKWCCKCSNKFHYINYDWLQVNSTYIGMQTVNNYTVQHWTKQGAYLNHYYNTVGGFPVKFFEIKNGNPKSWDFDLSTFVKGAPQSTLFAPPANCSNLCLGQCRLFAHEQKLHLTSEE